MTPTPAQRPVWLDRFEKPEVEALVAGLDEGAEAFEAMRSLLIEGYEARESVEWRGAPWRWAMAYAIGAEDAPVVVFLIPNPESPLISLPVPISIAARSVPRSAPKPFRDAFEGSKQVGKVLWTEWDLRPEVIAEPVRALLEAMLGPPRQDDEQPG